MKFKKNKRHKVKFVIRHLQYGYVKSWDVIEGYIVDLPSYPAFGFYVHHPYKERNKRGWVITEKTTGLKVLTKTLPTIQQAIKATEDHIHNSTHGSQIDLQKAIDKCEKVPSIKSVELTLKEVKNETKSSS